MTVVLRDEFTGKSIRLTQVQKLFEDGNYIQVYFNRDGINDMTSYAFASVVSVDMQDIWQE